MLITLLPQNFGPYPLYKARHGLLIAYGTTHLQAISNLLGIINLLNS